MATDGESGLTLRATQHVEGFLSALAPYKNRSDGWIIGLNDSIGHLRESGEAHATGITRGAPLAPRSNE